jgi:hypothetical protein
MTREQRVDAAMKVCSQAVVGLTMEDAFTVAAVLAASLCKTAESQGGQHVRLQARAFVERFIGVMSRDSNPRR